MIKVGGGRDNGKKSVVEEAELYGIVLIEMKGN